MVTSSHGLEFYNNPNEYELTTIIPHAHVAAQSGLTMIENDAVHPHGSPRFDSNILEDQGEFFHSGEPDVREDQRGGHKRR